PDSRLVEAVDLEARAVSQLLRRLAYPCCADMAALLRMGTAGRFFTMQWPLKTVSAVAIAFYDFHKHCIASRRGRSRATLPFSMHGTPLFQSAQGCALVYRYELVGLACALLLRTMRQPDQVVAHFGTLLPRERFTPTWRLE